MRIAYLECFAGIAGDMFLGALVQAGVPAEVLQEATAALNLGANLKITTVDRSGISSFKVDVLDHGCLAEERPYSHTHVDFKAPSDDDQAHQQEGREFEQMQQPRTQHHHRGGHAPMHENDPTPEHDPTHGRSLTEIRTIIRAASLKDEVKDLAIRTFELLGHSEAKIHNIPVDSIHFHEVGAVDAIVDIVAASAGIHHLQIGAWYSSPVNVGSGMVECAHGTFPVPAPAVADLLRGFPTYAAHVQKELVTPTGAALLRTLNPTFGPQPAMRVSSIGYGAGTRNPANFPNVLRLTLGEMDGASPTQTQTETVTVLETALDDQSPQLIAHVAEMALVAGALDVMLTPVIMKKGRPGTLLTVLCRPSQSAAFEQMLFRDTTTLGIRIRQDKRVILERSHTTVETSYGPIRMKIGARDGEVLNVAPEFEDCRAAAVEHHVSVKLVQQAAIAAYAEGTQR